MLERLRRVVAELQACNAAIDPSLVDGDTALALTECWVQVERVAASGRLRAAHRVQQTKAYAAVGHRSAPAWLAEVAGTSRGQATAALTTAQRLEGLPVTAQALAGGLVSEAEAAAIASGAEYDRAAEAELLASGQHDSLAELRAKSDRRRAAALGDLDRDERLHRRRALWDGRDAEGATRIGMRVAPEVGARLLAAIDARAQEIFNEAYREGRRESLSAYRLDALVSLVDDGARGGGTGRGRGVDTCVNVIIDYAALVRGATESGETCHIPGVGPVSVAAARRLLSDAVLKLIVSDGVDVYNVVHAGRTIPAHVRSALEVRDQTCCRPSCDQQRRLQIHHYKVDYHKLPVAHLDGLARLCPYDHRQVTLGRARLDGGPGHWRWTVLGPASTSGPDPPPAASP